LLVHLTFWQQPFIKIIVGTTTSEIYTTYIGTAGLLLNTKWNVRNGKVSLQRDTDDHFYHAVFAVFIGKYFISNCHCIVF
jgi:hypothetical protein